MDEYHFHPKTDYRNHPVVDEFIIFIQRVIIEIAGWMQVCNRPIPAENIACVMAGDLNTLSQ